MKVVIFFTLLGLVLCEEQRFAHQSVFDYTKILTVPEIQALLSSKSVQWPERPDHDIPAPSFTCADKQYPGYYADPATQCQTFHRCDPNGNMTSYICLNMTVFNPITLICDFWFNVDCEGFIKDENFGNRRLYSSLWLFDSPNAPKAEKTTAKPATTTADIHSGKYVWVEDKPSKAAAAGTTTAASSESAATEAPEEATTAQA